MKTASESDTGDFVLCPAVFAHQGPGVASAQVRVDLGALSHQGKVRSNNEDHYLVARFGRFLHPMLSNLPEYCVPHAHEEIGYGMLVADGMGGVAGGEVASRTAIQGLVDLVLSTPDWILVTDGPLIDEVMDRMSERFRQLDDRIVQHADADPRLTGMGTTMTLVYSLGLGVVLGHVGDSRAYLYRQGMLKQLTRDMTQAQALVEAGVISPAEAARHRFRHVLTQCLGGGGPLAVQVQTLALQDGDRLLVCSDGLTEMVEDGQIANILAEPILPQIACQALVNRALDQGGKDNVTVVLADYHTGGIGGMFAYQGDSGPKD
jgi:protein phosphatase